MVTTVSPRTIYGCFPPMNGPSKPIFLSRETSSLQATGPSLGNVQLLRYFQLDAVNGRDRQTAG